MLKSKIQFVTYSNIQRLMKRFRLLGYYCNPGQNVNPESKQVQEANELAPLLEASINSILLNPDARSEERRVGKE